MSYCASYPKQLLFSSLGSVVDGKCWRGPPAPLGWEIPWHLWVSSWWSGNSGRSCLCEFGEFMPCTLPSSSFACLAPKASGFPSPPPVLLFAVTDLPEMLKDFAILLFRAKKTFFPHGETAMWLQSAPTLPPSPAFSLRNQIMTLLTSLLPVLPEPNMNYSSNPPWEWFKVEQLGSKTLRVRARVCKVWHRWMHLLHEPLASMGKGRTWESAPKPHPLLITLI